MNDEMTLPEQAQLALDSLLSSHPDTATAELERVLERVGPDSPDAPIIQRAIDRLLAISREIEEVEVFLTEADFTFGVIASGAVWRGPGQPLGGDK
jgi:hypothetical protein